MYIYIYIYLCVCGEREREREREREIMNFIVSVKASSDLLRLVKRMVATNLAAWPI